MGGGGGDTGIGEMEKKKGDEGWEKGEIGENYATMLDRKPRKRGRGGGVGEPRMRGTIREAGDLDRLKKARNKNLNSSLSFWQAALKFCLLGATSQQFTINIHIYFSKILEGNSTTQKL